ncbi:NlpC/P60 family protein [Actinomadura sp. ATCC 31491]|uniref:NlpC/P60 family protein n=1 Tax=Actinomadura luzonensis TaxID=2805427 RepID=A0ABT0FYD9_9ACTN|nr:C40 family peptidase [Actinomadura luzonensis]MCK2216960.1 NlpC/P60 family protein [Actinomadura luzonensis]
MPTGLARMATTALAMTVAMTVALTAVAAGRPGAALAEPAPTPAQARAKLTQLNEQADQLVEQYNQATESYRKARTAYAELDAEIRRKDAAAGALRRDLMAAVVSDYQTGRVDGYARLVGQGSPEALLGGMAALGQIAQARAAKLRAYEAAGADLRERHARAKVVLAQADAARDKVRARQQKVDKLVAEQTRILRRLGAFRSGDPASAGITYSGPASGSARTALRFAFAQVGKPYRYGGTGPGSYDCSGLTQAAWRAAGVRLPRTTYTQWSWGASRRVPLTALQPGDLLFSRGLGHMGMYAGGGKMVHAPQTGDVVKVVNLDDYWRGRLIGAVRP